MEILNGNIVVKPVDLNSVVSKGWFGGTPIFVEHPYTRDSHLDGLPE